MNIEEKVSDEEMQWKKVKTEIKERPLRFIMNSMFLPTYSLKAARNMPKDDILKRKVMASAVVAEIAKVGLYAGIAYDIYYFFIR